VVTGAVCIDALFNSDEEKGLAFIRQYHLDMFPKLLEDSRFNRRRHALSTAIEALRCHFRDAWRQASPLADDATALRVIDSAPIPT